MPLKKWTVNLRKSYRKGTLGITGTPINIANWYLDGAMVRLTPGKPENPEQETKRLLDQIHHGLDYPSIDISCIAIDNRYALFAQPTHEPIVANKIPHKLLLTPEIPFDSYYIMACSDCQSSAHAKIAALQQIKDHALKTDVVLVTHETGPPKRRTRSLFY